MLHVCLQSELHALKTEAGRKFPKVREGAERADRCLREIIEAGAASDADVAVAVRRMGEMEEMLAPALLALETKNAKFMALGYLLWFVVYSMMHVVFQRAPVYVPAQTRTHALHAHWLACMCACATSLAGFASARIRTRVRELGHTHTHTRTHARTHSRTHARTHARARAHTHTHANTHKHTQTHTQTYARARTHTHTHAHAHTR